MQKRRPHRFAPRQPRRANRIAPRQIRRKDLLRWSAAVVTSGAGVIHLLLAQEHFREDVLYGTFFIAAGIAQLFLAVLLLPPRSAWLYRVAAFGSLGIVGLWSFTRTFGPPIGAGAWHVEPVGSADLLSAFLELAAAACLVCLAANGSWAISRREPHISRRRVRLILAALALVTGLLVSSFGVPADAACQATPANHAMKDQSGAGKCAESPA